MIASSALIRTPVDICIVLADVAKMLALVLGIGVCKEVLADLPAAFLASDEPPVQELLLAALYAVLLLSRGGIVVEIF